MATRIRNRVLLLLATLAIIITASIRFHADTGTCGGTSTTLPFLDVSSTNIFFCVIAEAYLTGLTNGTDPAHYSPSANVPREQMAAFITRAMDQSLKRGSRRAALRQFWTTQSALNLGATSVAEPDLVESDGTDLWVSSFTSNSVSRVRASDGKLLETWTGATNAAAILCAMGKVFVTGLTPQAALYQIDPSQPAGTVTTLTTSLGALPTGITFDGLRIWTTNNLGESVSIITLNPVTVTTVNTVGSPTGILFDGANIWVADTRDRTIKKLDSSGNVLLSVNVGFLPKYPVFDGTNIWVPNEGSSTISVVRATGALSGTVLATLAGNGLFAPSVAAFDGERILVTNSQDSTVSLWKASDLTPIGTFSTGEFTGPLGVCSDGLNFWIALNNAEQLARF